MVFIVVILVAHGQALRLHRDARLPRGALRGHLPDPRDGDLDGEGSCTGFTVASTAYASRRSNKLAIACLKRVVICLFRVTF